MDNNTIEELIDSIIPNAANFDYIKMRHRINGSLWLDIERVMKQYASQEIKAKDEEIVQLKTELSKSQNETYQYKLTI
jgi:hypothetical protein